MPYLGVFKAEHVQYPDEAVGGMSYCRVQHAHALAGPAPCRPYSGRVSRLGVKVDVRVVRGAQGARGRADSLQGVGATDDGGDSAAVERLGQRVPRHTGENGGGGATVRV